MYAIIDIETTGGSAVYDKITEIAVYIHDGKKLIGEYSTLLNPGKPIPYYITKLTGINDQMVANAPSFDQIASIIDDLTKGCFFVAHNVSFDYNFVREEYRRLGVKFERPTLCTVRLSRKLIPGKRSYSLGNLCNEIGIHIKDRHRASGDALATVKLFELLLQVEPNLSSSNTPKLPNGMPHNLLDKIPETTGVYYFYNENNDLIYIGKSINIRERVISHFNNRTGNKAQEMKSRTHHIDSEVTGSELIALLMESDEIKKNKPVFNRAQRHISERFGIASIVDDKGYISLQVVKNSTDIEPIVSLNSLVSAKKSLEELTEKYFLCQKINGLYQTHGACFQYGLGVCLGACVGKEDTESYNRRVKEATKQFEYVCSNMIILDKGRSMNEKSVVLVENGKYKGFGYIDTTCFGGSIEELKECIKPYSDNRDVQQIINSYLSKHKVEKMIKF